MSKEELKKDECLKGDGEMVSEDYDETVEGLSTCLHCPHFKYVDGVATCDNNKTEDNF